MERKCDCREKKRLWYVSGLLITLSFMTTVNAMELGGFDVTTGTADFEDEMWDWEEPPSPETTVSNGDETVSNEINESNSNVNIQIPQVSEEKNTQENNVFQSSADESVSEVLPTTVPQSVSTPSVQEETLQVTPVQKLTPTVIQMPSPIITQTPSASLTPVHSPTVLPSQRAEQITAYTEDYKIPPAECLQKMGLLYWKTEAEPGKILKISLDWEIAKEAVSVRVDGREISWMSKENCLEIQLPSKEDEAESSLCTVEMMLMANRDFTWTQKQKNVILSYNVFDA